MAITRLLTALSLLTILGCTYAQEDQVATGAEAEEDTRKLGTACEIDNDSDGGWDGGPDAAWDRCYVKTHEVHGRLYYYKHRDTGKRQWAQPGRVVKFKFPVGSKVLFKGKEFTVEFNELGDDQRTHYYEILEVGSDFKVIDVTEAELTLVTAQTAAEAKARAEREKNFVPAKVNMLPPPKWSNNGEVKHLNDFTFKVYTEEERFFAMFYAPWCPHCKRLKPVFVKASKEAKKLLRFVAIDCTKNRITCKKHKVRTFPTLKYHTPKDPIGYAYKGPRDLESFLGFAQAAADQDGGVEGGAEEGTGDEEDDHVFSNLFEEEDAEQDPRAEL